MIHPSYTELIDAINENSEDDNSAITINSRYSLVQATSKRARELIAKKKPLENEGGKCNKPLSVAIDEFYRGKVKIREELPEEEGLSESLDDMLKDAIAEETPAGE